MIKTLRCCPSYPSWDHYIKMQYPSPISFSPSMPCQVQRGKKHWHVDISDISWNMGSCSPKSPNHCFPHAKQKTMNLDENEYNLALQIFADVFRMCSSQASKTTSNSSSEYSFRQPFLVKKTSSEQGISPLIAFLCPHTTQVYFTCVCTEKQWHNCM